LTETLTVAVAKAGFSPADALLLRGPAEFGDLADYRRFVDGVSASNDRNAKQIDRKVISLWAASRGDPVAKK
jgi:hypothetical protein